VSADQACGVGSAQHGECWLPAGHAGDHEARDTAATWKPISTLVAQMEGWVPRSRVEAAESALKAALAERDAMKSALDYLADPESWGGNPLSQEATLYGHDTPFELARGVLGRLGDTGRENDA
jgi:hypothetical protein